jgi:hypothetical protein
MATNTGTMFRVRLTGTRPLMMSSGEGVMPRGEIGDRLRELNAKKKLTDADKAERARLKYHIAVYWDDKLGVYIPGHNVWATGKAAAKLHKLGEKWKQGVQVIEEKLPLIYDGPRTIESLYADTRFVDTRPVTLAGKTRIEAVRPIFPQWSVEATFTVDDEFINLSDVKRALTIAGPAIGLGTYRERFGRFETEFLDNDRKKKAA